MHKKITLIAGLLLLLGLPHLTSAQNYDYIPSTEFFSQFANPRNAEIIAAQQQQESEARRNAAYAAANQEDETTHASAEEQETVTNTNSGTEYQFSISSDTLRALERIEQQKAENELRAQALELLGADLTLHAGADLTGKGGITGKGVTGKGTPTFLPTSTTTLSGTGYGSAVLFVACGLVALLSLVVLRRKQTVFVAQ